MRALPRSLTALLLVLPMSGYTLDAPAGPSTPGPVRLAIVNTPKISGLIDDLVADYRVSGGGDVTVYGGNDVYDKARAGEADLVISHYGKAEVERFVLDGFGA